MNEPHIEFQENRVCLPNLITYTSASVVGGSTTLNVVRNMLPRFWRFICAGDIMREYARESGFDHVGDFRKHLLETANHGYDHKVDSQIVEFGEQNFCAFEGRLVHFFVKKAYHVLLECDIYERALRNQRRYKKVGKIITIEEAKEDILTRDHDDQEQFIKMYGAECIWRRDQYDLIINTHLYKPQEVAYASLNGHKKWLVYMETADRVVSDKKFSLQSAV